MIANKSYLQTSRRKMAYYRQGIGNDKKIILLHGNASGSAFYLPLIQRLCDEYDVVAPDLNGYGKTEATPIHAPTGLLDWAEDIDALAEALDFSYFALLGWSLGGGVAMRYAIEHSEKLTHLILISPMSPFGFGGTYDEDGKMYNKKGRGCAGGFANPDFLASLINKDTSDGDSTARGVMRKTYFKPGFQPDPEWEDVFVNEILDMQIGPDYYPGDYKKSLQFPFVLPGQRGINNALAPQYADVSRIVDIEHQPDILWFRGDADLLVADGSYADLAMLGKLGLVPKYPGEEKMPPQPMISQTRYVLEKYQANGGHYTELIIEDAGHSCHIEQEDVFVALLKKHLS